MFQKILLWSKSKVGATAIEYSLIIAGLAIAIIASLILLRPQLQGLYTAVNTGFTTLTG